MKLHHVEIQKYTKPYEHLFKYHILGFCIYFRHHGYESVGYVWQEDLSSTRSNQKSFYCEHIEINDEMVYNEFYHKSYRNTKRKSKIKKLNKMIIEFITKH